MVGRRGGGPLGLGQWLRGEGVSWSLVLSHNDIMRVSWLGLRPRVEVRRFDGGLAVYRPKVSGNMTVEALTTAGRRVTFGQGA